MNYQNSIMEFEKKLEIVSKKEFDSGLYIMKNI